MTRIAVLGAGVHGREVAAVIGDAYVDPILYDDNRDAHPHLLDTLTGARTYPWVIGAAWPQVRRDLAERLTERGVQRSHEAGRVIWPGVHLGHDVRLGFHVHVGHNAVVSHGCHVQSYAHIAAGAVLGGDVLIGQGAFVGAGAVVSHGGITIGPGALIGAGAVLIDDAIAGAVYAGNPARLIATEWHWTEMAHGGRKRAANLAAGAEALAALTRKDPAA